MALGGGESGSVGDQTVASTAPVDPAGRGGVGLKEADRLVGGVLYKDAVSLMIVQCVL